MKDHNEQAKRWRVEKVRGFINDPESYPVGYEECPDVNSVALLLFHEATSWEDRFCLAVMFRLPMRLQKLAVWGFVTDAIRSRFSWKTRLGFNMEKVFAHIGIILSEFPISEDDNIPLGLVCEVIHIFDLPTQRLGAKEKLTSKEEAFRQLLNRVVKDSVL